MKLIYNKLGNENQHMFYNNIKKKKPFSRNLLDTYLKPKAHIEKQMSKAIICILKNLFKNDFYNLKYENQCIIVLTYIFSIIEMKTFNTFHNL